MVNEEGRLLLAYRTSILTREARRATFRGENQSNGRPLYHLAQTVLTRVKSRSPIESRLASIDLLTSNGSSGAPHVLNGVARVPTRR
jgi:hypothetical protein